MAEVAISVNNLIKSYGNKEVLRGVSFSVKQGEIFSLLGVNGAGKTTTMECIEGLRKPNSGELTVGGFSVAKEINKVTKILGVQLQSTALPDAITSKEAMQLFCAWHSVPYRKDLLERFDMAGEYLNKTYASLSTGRKRRLHLALALCHNPTVLILDEPTAGLDVEGRNALHREMRTLNDEGVSILMATHDMAEAESMSDRIAILRYGVIVQEGSPMELTATANVQSRVTLKTRSGCLLKQIPVQIEKCEQLEDEYVSFACKDAATLLLVLLRYIQEQNDNVIDLRVERASIEDIFLSIAAEGKA